MKDKIEVQTKTILNASDCKKLLKRGHKILDIMPKLGDEKMTVFVFEATPAFMEDYEKMIKK